MVLSLRRFVQLYFIFYRLTANGNYRLLYNHDKMDLVSFSPCIHGQAVINASLNRINPSYKSIPPLFLSKWRLLKDVLFWHMIISIILDALTVDLEHFQLLFPDNKFKKKRKEKKNRGNSGRLWWMNTLRLVRFHKLQSEVSQRSLFICMWQNKL